MMRGVSFRSRDVPLRILAAAASLAVVLLTGCAQPPRSGATGEPARLVPADSALRSATPSREDGFLGVLGDLTGDASRVASLVAATAAGRDRFVVGFARADGLPAERIGPVRVEILRELGLVRLHLPAQVTGAALTENHFTGDLSGAAFVVRALAGESLFIDLHLRKEARARAYALRSPALLVVELEPGGPPLSPWPAEGPGVVVLTPRRDSPLHYPLEVSGYARTFEAHVVAELRQQGRAVAKTFTTASDYASAWGEFRMRLETGPRGPARLFVGDYSAKDGSEQGVTIDLAAP